MKFYPTQRRITAGIVLAYTCAYLCRLNLSAALGGITESLQISDTQAGTLQTAFAIVYAAGQLINGAIVDRLNPFRHIMTSLIGFSICNLLMGFCSSYPLLLCLCFMNGVFQSMLWTPIVRLMARFYPTKVERSKASLAFSTCMIVGHLGAWSISGVMVNTLGWGLAFTIPGIIAFIGMLIVRCLLREAKDMGSQPVVKASRNQEAHSHSLLGMFASTGLLFLLGACILYGFVRDGIVTWAPKTLGGLGSGGLAAVASSLIIPMINIVGYTTGNYLNRKGIKNTRLCIALMTSAAMLFCALLSLNGGMWITALLMGLGCASLNGLNPLLTALVPLEYDKTRRVSLVAGLIDSFIYIGSALAGFVGGSISEGLGASALFIAWAIAACAAAVLILLSSRKKCLKALDDYAV